MSDFDEYDFAVLMEAKTIQYNEDILHFHTNFEKNSHVVTEEANLFFTKILSDIVSYFTINASPSSNIIKLYFEATLAADFVSQQNPFIKLLEQNLLLLQTVLETKVDKTFQDKMCYAECIGEIAIRFPKSCTMETKEIFNLFDKLNDEIQIKEEVYNQKNIKKATKNRANKNRAKKNRATKNKCNTNQTDMDMEHIGDVNKVKLHFAIFCYRWAQFLSNKGDDTEVLRELRNLIWYVNFPKEKTLEYHRMERELKIFATALRGYEIINSEENDLWMENLWK
jgi:hypothetical protein